MMASALEEVHLRAGESLWSAVAERLGERAGRAAALLVGSAAAGFADGHSRPDLLLVLPAEDLDAGAAALGLTPGEWGRLRLREVGGKACAVSADSLESAVAALADDALFLLRSGRILSDPAGVAARLAERARLVPPETWEAKAEAAYRAFRQRKASLAWAMRRGQPYVCLDNITRLVALSLRLCYYLAGKPPANAKWLFQGAMRTATGRRIRPILLDLFGALGEVAVLGGSYSLRHNAVYAVLTRLQRALEEELR